MLVHNAVTEFLFEVRGRKMYRNDKLTCLYYWLFTIDCELRWMPMGGGLETNVPCRIINTVAISSMVLPPNAQVIIAAWYGMVTWISLRREFCCVIGVIFYTWSSILKQTSNVWNNSCMEYSKLSHNLVAQKIFRVSKFTVYIWTRDVALVWAIRRCFCERTCHCNDAFDSEEWISINAITCMVKILLRSKKYRRSKAQTNS